MTERESILPSADPLAVREYLLTSAGTLLATLAPDYRGDTAARIQECARVIARIALELGPQNEPVVKALESLRAAPSDAKPAHEGLAREALENAAEEIYAFIDAIAKTPARGFDRARFEDYLCANRPGFKNARVADVKPLQGGRSKQTVLVSFLGQDADYPSEAVLRQDWGSGVPKNTTVVFEAEVVRRLHAAGLRVPKLLWLEPERDAMGAPFMVMSRIAGRQEGNLFSPPRSETMALQLAGQLGKLHALATDEFAAISGMPTKGHSRAQRAAELEQFHHLYQTIDHPSETIDAVFDFLSSANDLIDGPLSVLHGDLGFHNYLVNDGSLAGILDWELAHLGNPASDLGYCKGDVEQMTTWPRFLAAYRAAGGPELAPFTIDYYSLWTGLHLYALLLQARAGVSSGAVRDIEVIYCCVNLTPVLVNRMATQLRTASKAAEALKR